MSRGGSNKAGPPRLQQRARRPVELEEDHHLRAPGAERGGGGLCALRCSLGTTLELGYTTGLQAELEGA